MMDTAKRIVQRALKLGADEAEVFLSTSQGRGFAIEKNSISSISGGIEKGIGIRVIKDKRLGFAYCTQEKNADDSVARALSLSKLGKKSEFTFPEPGKFKEIEKTFDRKIENYSSEDALEDALAMVESGQNVDSDIVITRGGLSYGSESFVVANSKGLEVEDFGTEIHASISMVLKKNGLSTGFEDYVSRVLDIDFNKIGRECAELTVKGQNAQKVENKEMTCVLSPYALANLLEFITAPALYGEAAHKNESVYSEKKGEKVASKELTVIDDGCLAGGINSAVVDDEGVPSRRTELIKKGVLYGFLYSQSSSIEFGEENTANAMRAERFASSRNYKSPPGAKARNLVIEGKTKGVETLISEVDEGVLVYEILGAHTSNPASGDFSVESSILFKIEHGEIVYPVKGAMLSGNFPECLRRVEGIGNDHRFLSGGLTPVCFYIPTISVGGVRLTG